MGRRSVQTTVKVTREKRVEFTAAELRKRLRLPEGAVILFRDDDEKETHAWATGAALVATWTTTSEPRREGSA